MARMLRFNFLGRFEAVGSDDEPLELNNKKARALLAYLAVESARPHTRDRLAGMLWSETGDERARHNLRQSLSAIRRSCGPVILARRDLLELDRTKCSADVIDFERLARSGDHSDLGRSLELYRGDLLEDFDAREPVFDEWLNLARARLRKVACQAVDDLVRALSAENRNEEAIDALERRLALDPACEAAHRRLMELLACSGRRSDALQQYRSCVETLQRELGAEPDPETKRLYARLQKSEEPGDLPASSTVAPAANADKPRLAVLPFANLSGDDDAYFVDGIVEDITTALSCFHSLVVIARGSSFTYRGRDVPERQIAEELGTQFLVRGSVRRAGKKIRVNIQLLDALAGLQLWGHRFDHDLEDVFAVQDEITSTVASTLVGRIEAARLTRVREAPTRILDAYDLYLRGKDHHHRYTPEDCQTCIDFFGRAIERDPGFAAAHAWLACGLGQAMSFRLDDQSDLVDRSQASAERGLELDENESECHRILAQVFLIRRNLQKSLWHQERALFLNPNDDRSVCAMGEILSFVGRHQEAEGWVRKSMQLNPYHPSRYWTHLGRALFHLERFEEALQAFEHIPRLRPDDHAYRVGASARQGDRPALQRYVTALQEALPRFDPVDFADSLPYERDEDRRVLLEALVASGLGG